MLKSRLSDSEETSMSESQSSMPDKRGFLYLIAIIAMLTVLLAANAGRSPLDILAYLGFTTAITYIFFG